MNLNAAAIRTRVQFTPPVAALVVSAVLCAVYVVWAPVSPDLAAQLARADLVSRAGNVSWWTGWFGGLSLPSYSVITPPMMAAIGVTVSGALLTVAGCWGAGLLLRDTLRPRAGAIAFSVFSVADLLVGRVTFAIGLAFGIWALVALRSHLPVLSVALAVLTYLSSPLAGLFLGMVLLAVVIADRSRRLQAAVAAGVLLVSGVAMAVFFPGTGVMHFGPTSAIAPALGCALIAFVCPTRVVRTAALLSLAALPAFKIVPGAVGSNVERLAWVCTVPVLVACAPLGRRTLATVVAALAVWPAIDVAIQVRWSTDPSTQAGYYQPLVHQLTLAGAAAGPSAIGERVELLDTVNHSGSLYVSRSFALARGWDRQADMANNAIFYHDGELTSGSYHRWLHQLAVGWVAVPATRLDYASRGEADLVKAGLPYLDRIWSSPQWQLYRVSDAEPLATGASVAAVGASSVTLHASGPATVLLRVRWSPYLRVRDPVTGSGSTACVARAGDWTQVHLPAAGEYMVVSSFNPTARFHSPDDSCASNDRQ